MNRNGVEHRLHRSGAAYLAALRRRIAHALEELEGVPFGTAVLVRGHEAKAEPVGANPTRTVGTHWHSPADSANARRVGTLFYVQAAISRRAYLLGVATATAGVAAFLLAQLHAWPPHEDETLALFIGSKPLPDMFATVLGERGGAPLHFLLVHIAAWLSPTLTAVRLISVVFAVASIPVIAALLSRLAGRRLALVGTVLVAASWVLLFHGIYGRMYSLFLFTSALSFLALLRALDRRRPLDWGLWGLALLATLSCHQYGAFILGIEVVFAAVLWRRDRFPLVAPLVALVAVVAAAAPIWRSNLVLASRFDVGVGDGGTQLGGPLPVLEYLRSALGDFVAGWLAVFAIVCALAVLGIWALARERPRAALLAGLVFLVPTLGLMLARVGGSASAPETRHLIFALPFFSLLVAAGLLWLTARAGPRATTALALSVAALGATQIAWGWQTTPTLYAGEPQRRVAAREAAASWLAQTTRPTDVLFGYDPLYLGAREDGAKLGETIVPRADPKLALRTLLDAPKPLGRGVWILDASDGSRITNNQSRRLEIDNLSPGPQFETRAFGPFLVVRTREPTLTAAEFLRDTVRVQAVGYWYLGSRAPP